MSFRNLENAVEKWSFYDVKEQLRQYIYVRSEQAFAKGDEARDKLKNIKDIEIRKETMRSRFIDAIGGLPPTDTPLNPRITGILCCDGFKIEKVIFESRPDTYVTANMYIPDNCCSPSAAVLFLCGHSKNAKQDEGYQVVCRYLVAAGLVVLAIDPIGQGERLSYYEKSINDTTVKWGTFEHDYTGAQCLPLGNCMAKYFLHDSIRAVDYLCTRKEVDPAKIGVTGNSGGGLQTCMMMVCDSRIAAAAPGTFVMNRRTNLHASVHQDHEQMWPKMSMEGLDHEDILLMMAPKPVLVLSVKYDFFPIEGTRQTVERTRRFWELYGKTGCMKLHEETSQHCYTRNMAKKAAEFFSLHLSGRKITPCDETIKDIEPRLLWCTKSGQVLGEIEGARTVHDENLKNLKQLENRRKAFKDEDLKDMAHKWLEERVKTGRQPSDINMRIAGDFMMHDFRIHDILWWSQKEVFNHAFIFTGGDYTNIKKTITIAVWNGGTGNIQGHSDWIRKECGLGRSVLVLDVSGVGVCQPNRAAGYELLDNGGLIQKLSYDLIWIGDSLAALRTYDVIRTVDMLEECFGIQNGDIRLYAHGRYGVYAQLAAFLDKRINGIDVVQGMGSYAAWVGARHYDYYDINSVILPEVLKYFDLPDLERWTKEGK